MRGKLPLPLKIMRLHIILASILQASISIFYFLHIKHGWLFYLYIIEEFVLDMLFYRELIKKTYSFKDKVEKRNIFLVAIGLFIVFAIVNVFITSIDTFPKYIFIVQCIVMIICTSWYNYTRSFYEPTPIVHSELSAFKLYKGPVFWMNTGKLIYFASSLFIFLPYDIVFKPTQQHTDVLVWSMQNILVIVLHIFMGIGFLKYKSNPTDVADMEQKLNKQL